MPGSFFNVIIGKSVHTAKPVVDGGTFVIKNIVAVSLCTWGRSRKIHLQLFKQSFFYHVQIFTSAIITSLVLTITYSRIYRIWNERPMLLRSISSTVYFTGIWFVLLSYVAYYTLICKNRPAKHMLRWWLAHISLIPLSILSYILYLLSSTMKRFACW